jgi:hypothetical protein
MQRAPHALVTGLVVGAVASVLTACSTTGDARSGRTPSVDLSSAVTGSVEEPTVEQTLTGTIETGVEGCTVLRTGANAFELLDLPHPLPVGSTVTLRGREAPEVRTTCQAGTPLRVLAVLSQQGGSAPTDPAT